MKRWNRWLRSSLLAWSPIGPLPAFHYAVVIGLAPLGFPVEVVAEERTERVGPTEYAIRLEPLDPLAQYPPVVTALACSPDGNWLVAAGDDHALRIVQISDGKILATLEGHSDWVQAVAIAQNNALILSCSKDRTLRAWRKSDGWKGTILFESDVALLAMGVDPHHRYVASGGFGDHLWIHSLEDGRLIKTLQCETADQRAVAFSSDGQRLAAGGRDGVVRLWDWETEQRPLHQQLHQDRIRSVQFADGDQVIVSVGEDRRMVRYEPRSGRILLDRKFHGGRLLSLTSIDADTVAVAGSDNTIRLIDVRTGEEQQRLVGHDGSVAVMIRSGSMLVSGSFDTTIRFWDLQHAQQSRPGRYQHPVSARFQDSGVGETVK